MVEEYFGDRHWDMVSLEAAVRRGCALEESTGLRFTWLTCTNAGAAEVCRAALAVAGIGEERRRKIKAPVIGTALQALSPADQACAFLLGRAHKFFHFFELLQVSERSHLCCLLFRVTDNNIQRTGRQLRQGFFINAFFNKDSAAGNAGLSA